MWASVRNQGQEVGPSRPTHLQSTDASLRDRAGLFTHPVDETEAIIEKGQGRWGWAEEPSRQDATTKAETTARFCREFIMA